MKVLCAAHDQLLDHVLLDVLRDVDSILQMLADFEHDRTDEIMVRFEDLAARYPEDSHLRAAVERSKLMYIRVAE